MNKNIKILPYKLGSESATMLAAYFECLKIENVKDWIDNLNGSNEGLFLIFFGVAITLYSKYLYKIWKKEGLEDFLNGCKLKTKNRWSVQDIELVFKENEGLKTLVYSVGLKKHYIKLLLLKEMIEMRNNTDINDDDPTILKQEKLRM